MPCHSRPASIRSAATEAHQRREVGRDRVFASVRYSCSISDMSMSTITAIREEFEQAGPGALIPTSRLLRHGTRAAVDQALSRLGRAGEINAPLVASTTGRRRAASPDRSLPSPRPWPRPWPSAGASRSPYMAPKPLAGSA